jgi:non-ribosomal peptide synthetase component F
VTVEFPVDGDRIDDSARRRGTGRLAVLLCELGRTMVEVTGQEDFGVGVPVTLRSAEGCERIVGCLINTVCVRLPPAGSDSATAAAVASALANADLPFGDVVRLARRRQTGRNPLYQMMVAVQDAPEPDLRLGAATVHRLVLDGELPPPVELVVELLAATGSRVRVRADGRRVDPATAQAIAAELQHRLSCVG